MPTVDFSPGEHSSEHGRWYLACESDNGILVGRKGGPGELEIAPNGWTMPVLGMSFHPCTFEQLMALEDKSTMVIGSLDGPALFRCKQRVWRNVFDEDVTGEWGNTTRSVCWLSTDAEEVIRLHVAFE